MKTRKDIADTFLFSAAKHATFIGEDKLHQLQFGRNLTGYLFFAGAEAVSVVFRKNHHMKTLNKGALIAACIVFAAISAFSFYQLIEENLTDKEQNQAFIRGVIYALITVLVIWQGYEKYKKANETSIYSMGQSYLQAFFKDEVKNHDHLIYIYEPVLLIAIGVCYSFYDVIGGLPIIACGVSTWIMAALVKAIMGNHVQQEINKETKHNSNSGFTS